MAAPIQPGNLCGKVVAAVEELLSLLGATLRLSTPLIFAALGGIASERSGVVNIGLEGMLLAGAFGAMAGSFTTGSPWIGLTWGIAGATLVAFLHAVATVSFHANQIVSGLALNLIALGATGYALATVFGSAGTSPVVPGFEAISIPVLSDIPAIGPVLFEGSAFIYLALIAVPVEWWVLFRTKSGLRLRGAGESPEAVEVAGVSVVKMRYLGVLVSGVMCGLGGSFLTLSLLNVFTEGMTGGRGYIALAALIFGRWNPVGALGACLLFGVTTALTYQIPQSIIDSHLIFMLPYVVTIVALASFGGRAIAPAAVGQPYRKE